MAQSDYKYQKLYDEIYFKRSLSSGIILDSNILIWVLLYLFDKNNNTKYSNRVSIQRYEVSISLLARFLTISCRWYITQHILSEISNKVENIMDGKHLAQFIDLMKSTFDNYKEVDWIDKDTVLTNESVKRFGVTDGVIMMLGEEGKIIVTGDDPLCTCCKTEKNLATLHVNDLTIIENTINALINSKS